MSKPIHLLSSYGQFTKLNPLTYQDKFSTYPVTSTDLVDKPKIGIKGALIWDTNISKYRFFTSNDTYREFARS